MNQKEPGIVENAENGWNITNDPLEKMFWQMQK